jgi:DNA-binding NarL/FixJ family response regulator
MMKRKIYIADDHLMVIEGLQSLLQGETTLQIIGYATNAKNCLESLKHLEPDVLLLDIALGKDSGIELCKAIKETYPMVMILAMSTFNQSSFIEKMMENGASGYLLKNADRTEIKTAIEIVVRGGTYYSREVRETLQQKKDSQQEKPILTRREKEVLLLIADGYNSHQIAEKLFIGTTTVDTHRKNLLTKFTVNNTAGLIKKAAQMDML